jgi:aspartyl-tRNA(Asn)/glutamyl-tRNA(Gln) amidotransferase subunit A
VVPLSKLLDHVGPIGRSVEDAGLLHHALIGVTPSPAIAARPVRGLRLGVPRGRFFAVMDSQVAAVFDDACRRLTQAGAVLDDVEIPHAGDAAAIYVHLVLPEAASYHAATLESRPGDYTPNVRLRIEMGRYILAEDYVRALRGRDALIADVDAALEGRDAIFLPTMPTVATKLGAATVSIDGSEEPVRNVMLRLTQLFNITGHAAISMPCGRNREGLPIGVQTVCRHTSDVLQIASAIEPVLER